MMKTNPPLTFKDSARWGALLVLGYVIIALLPLAVAYAMRPTEKGEFIHELSLGTALLGFTLLTMQPLLSARLHWIERPFGHHKLMRFHMRMAVVVTLLLLAHPLLLALGSGSLRLLTTWEMPWPIQLGRLALLILLIGVLTAVIRQKIPLDYNRWRGMHAGLILLPLLGAVHSLAIGHDLQNLPMQLLWYLLIALTLGLALYRRIWMPLAGGRSMRVEEVRAESPEVTTIRLRPEDGYPFSHRAGQFWFLNLRRPGRGSEEHPFTIASSPEQPDTPASSIKHSGNFTDTIALTRPGDRARIQGPYGHFTLDHHPGTAWLFIAGGIGITPLMSMMRHLRDTGDDRPLILLWANRQEQGIIFKEELDKLPDNMRVAHILSDAEEEWQGARGFVTADWIKKESGELLQDAQVFVCGPPPMMKSVRAALRSLGVPGDRIHDERFTF
jgi:predicted ferric reductase